MSLLRWILLIAGVVVIAAIYLWGRRNRRTQSVDRPKATVVGAKHAQAQAQAHGHENVPQLDEAVMVRARAAEPSTTNADGLPSMHAGGAADAGDFMQAAPPQRHEIELFIDEADDAPIVSTPVHVEPAPVRAPSPGLAPRQPKKVASRKIVALRLSAGSDGVEGARLKALLEASNLRHGKYSIYHRLHTDGSPLFSVASMVEPGTFDPFAMSGVKFPGVTLFMQLPGPIEGGEMFTQLLVCARELEQGVGGLLQDERGMPLTEQREQRLRDDVADFLHLLGSH